MTWRDAWTRELRLLELALGALILLVLVGEGFVLGTVVYGTVVTQQGATLDAMAARHCIWLDPPRDR